MWTEQNMRAKKREVKTLRHEAAYIVYPSARPQRGSVPRPFRVASILAEGGVVARCMFLLNNALGRISVVTRAEIH